MRAGGYRAGTAQGHRVEDLLIFTGEHLWPSIRDQHVRFRDVVTKTGVCSEGLAPADRQLDGITGLSPNPVL
jgi:hypothetical protein